MAGSNYIRKAPKAMIKACDAEYPGIAPCEPLSRVEVDQDSRLRSQVEQAASICQRAVDGMLEHEVPYCRAKRLYFTELAYWLFLLRRSDEAVIFLDRFHDDEGKVAADDICVTT